MGDDCRIRRSQKQLHNLRRVSRCFVVILGPGVVASILWTFIPNVLTSIASELYNRIFHSPSVLVEQISYARCFQYQNFATFSLVALVESRQERSPLSTDIRP